MELTAVLKAAADESRMKILKLLLGHNFCVRALARNLKLSEATISQHLKILREAGLLTGEKHGYFMHYDVNRTVLEELSAELKALAAVRREVCTPAKGGCRPSERENCHNKNECSKETKESCQGRSGSCSCHKGGNQ